MREFQEIKVELEASKGAMHSMSDAVLQMVAALLSSNK